MDYSFYDPRSQPSSFSLYGLPTPDQPHAQPDTFAPLNNYQNLPGFDPSFPVDPSFVPSPHTPPESVKHSASSDAANNQYTRPTSFDGDETQFADPTLGRSSSEEKESAPAQSKRKAQNRAAYVMYQNFHTTFMPDGPGTPRSPQHRLTVCPITGEKLLDARATWDLIQKHELFERGQLDIGDVTERLKGMSQCDGQGPAFKESQVRQAIEDSAAAGRDELI
ncbi:unnamed protein product [Penicillium nalgiovense]|nr:unnamed protein product [Penicillium nalgiovense]